jgi:hypothetical protein
VPAAADSAESEFQELDACMLAADLEALEALEARLNVEARLLQLLAMCDRRDEVT